MPKTIKLDRKEWNKFLKMVKEIIKFTADNPKATTSDIQEKFPNWHKFCDKYGKYLIFNYKFEVNGEIRDLGEEKIKIYKELGIDKQKCRVCGKYVKLDDWYQGAKVCSGCLGKGIEG